ncbi:MAG: NB-ARC domain-containing protein [Xenococcaceae cyanobacterium MO_167.B27]|nr:NB-ARC domain-containing protein [Xenococcaceae cyanobacterium MO_167.B27]
MTNENNQGINVKGGNNKIEHNILNFYPPEKPFKPIKYIPKNGSNNFVGRQDDLVKVHEELYEGKSNRVAISAVSGMGGVGKTELAIKYARKYYNDYSGGICWLNARGGNLATEIIQFIQLQMGLEVPQQDAQENALTLEEQIAWCWQNWQPPEGLVLVILDDVTHLESFSELLPPNDRFRVLITT